MDVNALKEIPGYKPIVKIVLQTQIQLLLEQLSEHTGGESIVMTAGVNDGSLAYYGSTAGRGFLENQDEMKSKFLAYCMKSHLLSKTVAVGKRTNESTHVEATRPTKQQRLAPSLVDTVTDNQLDRSFTAESFTDTESQIAVGDAQRGFMLNTSLPSLLDLNFTQTSHSDTSMSSTVDFNFTQTSQCNSTPSLDLPNGAPTDSALGSDLTSERGSNSDNLVHDSGRWNQGAVSIEEGNNVGVHRSIETAFIDMDAVTDLLDEDDNMSTDSSDHYFEEHEDNTEITKEGMGINSVIHDTVENQGESTGIGSVIHGTAENQGERIGIGSVRHSTVENQGERMGICSVRHDTVENQGERMGIGSVRHDTVENQGESTGIGSVIHDTVENSERNVGLSSNSYGSSENSGETIGVGPIEYGNDEIKQEIIDGESGIKKNAIESDNDVIIIDIDSENEMNPKDNNQNDKENEVNQGKMNEKDTENRKVKDQIGKYLAEQRKVIQSTSSPIKTGNEIKSVLPEQGNTSRSVVNRSNNVEKGFLQNKSRQQALKRSVSLLTKPLDVAVLNKRRDIKSKSPIRGFSSPSTKLKDDENKNNNDETPESTNVHVKNEPSCSVKAGEIDLRFSDTGRIKFNSGYCKYSEEEKRDITKYARKHSIEDASKVFIVPIPTVRHWMKSSALKASKQKYSDEKRAEILAYTKKHGILAASSVYNVPLSTVRTWYYLTKNSVDKKEKHKLGRKTRYRYSEGEKARIIQYAIENGKVATCKHFKVPFGTVSCWLTWKKQEEIRKAKSAAVLNQTEPVLRKKVGRHIKYGIEIEKKLVEWILEKVQKNEYVSGNMVRSYCLSLVKRKRPKFKATFGWLNAFLIRNNLKNLVSDVFKNSRQPVEDHSNATQVASKAFKTKDTDLAPDLKNSTGVRMRRTYTDGQKASILRYATVRSVRAACLFYKVNPSLLYSWRAASDVTKEKGKLNKQTTSRGAKNKSTGTEVSLQDTKTGNADNVNIGTDSSDSDANDQEREISMSEFDNARGDNSNNGEMKSRVSSVASGSASDSYRIEPRPNPKLNKRGRSLAYGDKIDHEIFWWIIQQGKEGKEVSGPMIKNHAISVVHRKRPDLNFKASDTWMQAFLKRHHLELHFSNDDA